MQKIRFSASTVTEEEGRERVLEGRVVRDEHALFLSLRNKTSGGFPGGAVVESPPADAGDMGSCPGLGGSHMPRSG